MEIKFEHGLLRSWRMQDAEALAAAANNRRVWLMLRDSMPHPYVITDAQSYLRKSLNDPLSFCIEVKGKFAGAIGLHPASDVHRLTAELGYWLAENFWRRGIVTAAVNALVAHAFAETKLQRIYASVFENNPASARVLEKAGFQFEGRQRRHVIKDGAILDSLLYARLRDQ